MKVVSGDIFSVIGQSHMFVITTNGVLKSDGSLVMGRGIAEQIAARYPTVPHLAGAVIAEGKFKKNYEITHQHKAWVYKYYFLKLPETNICLFQAKAGWWQAAQPIIIYQSAVALKEEIDKFRAIHGSDPIVNINFPGIGFGGLSENVVLSQIEHVLPDCVNVWKFSEEKVEKVGVT